MELRLFKRFLLSAAALFAFAGTARGQASLQSVEAAFILQFTKYIEFTPDASLPITRIVILGAPSISEFMQTALQEKPTIGGSIKLVAEEEIRDAHYIVIGQLDEKKRDRIDEVINSCRCVTIALSSYPGHAMIKLVQNQESLRFEVDKNFADKRGIYISSKLLRLATKVRN